MREITTATRHTHSSICQKEGNWMAPTKEFEGKADEKLFWEEKGWETFWDKRKFTSLGEGTLPGTVPVYAWYVPCPGDTTQVHPQHPEHRRVPWFQCITHGCVEHHAAKNFHGHWPVRKTRNGRTVPVKRTWSRYDSTELEIEDYLLWNEGMVIQKKDNLQVITFWPRNARTCEREDLELQTIVLNYICDNTECWIHINAKLRKFSRFRSSQIVRTGYAMEMENPVPGLEETEKEWLRAQRQWLAEFELLDNSKQEDAPEARQQSGKEPRPFAEAANL
ncbi:hypothetical protein QBC36DRAFT_201090 [Triangularia setosa]|uniref:Uncharacterized protein n=1 Tax=Triangularia setosa TaxID=2587417 RepID=A0AAN7A220_9PEZI|nr:hypothetical protein QBC36DRAFT_201090 [Podospora setosa]